uniref:Uncharacterized protein n=1 Tax=Anguilla anguilla TaxID=7936 RepID=A0A0E9VZM2_ANGAN
MNLKLNSGWMEFRAFIVFNTSDPHSLTVLSRQVSDRNPDFKFNLRHMAALCSSPWEQGVTRDYSCSR